MNKESFLKELSERLKVLNDQERQDVLEEYEQHIDLKIENGLSEEEAVRDFGTPEQLCEELLEVYHINSEYASGSVVQVQEDAKLTSKAANALKRVRGASATESSEKKKLFDKIPVFHGKKEEEANIKTEEERSRELEEKRMRNEERQMRRRKKQMQRDEKLLKREQKQRERLQRMAVFREEHRQKRLIRKEQCSQNGGPWIIRVVRKMGSLLLSISRCCWKICLFGVAVPFLVIAVIALFGTGVVWVLLQQGYPLIGVTLFGLGAFLCAAGISGLLLSYVFTGKRMKEK